MAQYHKCRVQVRLLQKRNLGLGRELDSCRRENSEKAAEVSVYFVWYTAVHCSRFIKSPKLCDSAIQNNLGQNFPKQLHSCSDVGTKTV